jgi:hypothetical protein
LPRRRPARAYIYYRTCRNTPEQPFNLNAARIRVAAARLWDRHSIMIFAGQSPDRDASPRDTLMRHHRDSERRRQTPCHGLAPSPSPSQLLILGGLRCAVGPAIPPPTPTPAHGTHSVPSLWPPPKFAASAFGTSACGAAASPRGFRVAASVSRPISRVLCRVYTPLPASPILRRISESLHCALPACQIRVIQVDSG